MDENEQNNIEPQETKEVEQTVKTTVEEPTVVIKAPEADTVRGAGWLLVLAIGLTLLVRRLGRIPNAHTLRRWLPLVYTMVWGSAVVGITAIYSKGLPASWRLVVWLVFLLVVFASVGWLRSVMSGVALALEGRIEEGDAVRIENVEGEIVAFGLRSIRVRSVDGTIHEIPNVKFVTEAVANISGDGGDSACEITLAVPDDVGPARALEIAREVAILTPLASPRHRPEVFLHPPEFPNEPYKVLVRGYAFDPTFQEHFRSDVVARYVEIMQNRE